MRSSTPFVLLFDFFGMHAMQASIAPTACMSNARALCAFDVTM
jgi:hypothetical protein